MPRTTSVVVWQRSSRLHSHLHAEPRGVGQECRVVSLDAEGRKLADFTSGVLVMNLGHNPTRWWNRVIQYLGLQNLKSAGAFCEAVTLNGYNAVTEVETDCCERLVSLMQKQPGGARCEQVLWAASGSEAIQKALWCAMDRRPGEDMILSTRYGFHGKKGLAGAVTVANKTKSAIRACGSSASHGRSASASRPVVSR